MGTVNPHDAALAEERLARQRHRQLEKARRVKARKQERERERAEAQRQRALERAAARRERDYQASLAEEDERQLSVVLTDGDVAEFVLGRWQRRGIECAIEQVRTKGGAEGLAVMRA